MHKTQNKLNGETTGRRICLSCETCGCLIETTLSRKNKRFCSRKCSSAWKSTAYAGRKISDEWKANQNHAKRRENIIKYGEYRCSSCNKEFETNLALRSHTSYCNSSTEAKNVTCQICNRVFSRERNLVVHTKLKHDDLRNAEHREKTSIGCKKRKSQKTSREEVEFLEQLRKFYAPHDVIHKFRVDEIRHEFDYYVPHLNLIVEFDGDFWHGNPLICKLDDRMKMQYMIDKSYTAKVKSLGYSIHRVWSSKSATYPNELRDF